MIFLKSRIDIFAAKKRRQGFYGMKISTEYINFLYRRHDIFADWMPTAKIWWLRKNGDLQYGNTIDIYQDKKMFAFFGGGKDNSTRLNKDKQVDFMNVDETFNPYILKLFYSSR